MATKKVVDVDVKEPNDLPKTVEAKKEETPKVVYGTVTAVRLNVRRAPSLDAAVAAIVNMDDELKIDRDKSDKEWYAVTTEKRVRGFVMRKFVKIKR
jgi:uncharacterized protein YgiM (DUF1202 family)